LQLSERCELQVDPVKQALHTSGKNGKQVFIWNQPPTMFCLQPGGQTKDVEPLPIMAWAEGRSYEQRMEIPPFRATL